MSYPAFLQTMYGKDLPRIGNREMDFKVVGNSKLQFRFSLYALSLQVLNTEPIRTSLSSRSKPRKAGTCSSGCNF